jgi:type II restriction enzyme
MPNLTPAELVQAIFQLDRSHAYDYISGNNSLFIRHIQLPEGPITLERAGRSGEPGQATVSREMLATAAFAFANKPDYPIHFDRLYSAGGNSRSAFETILAYTPHFFVCYPERVEIHTGKTTHDLKHLMWCPNETHELGKIASKDYNQIIAEVEVGLDFGVITGITITDLGAEFATIEAKKTHTQMQVALVEVGRALNFKTWIAQGDRSFKVGETELGQLDGVVASLDDIPMLYSQEIKQAAGFVDCIWFTEDMKHIPAVIEIEHSTGVTSGLTRMSKLKQAMPSFETRYTIVAPNELRGKVVSEANNPLFRGLNTRYMPYSTVRELYGLIKRYNLKNVVDRTFIYPFMESVTQG